MTNAEKYIEIFKKIESYLAKKYANDDHKPFMEMVRDLKKNNNIIRMFCDELREYAELRNAIVHKYSGGDKPIAEPYNETVAGIERIYNTLIKPPTAYEKAVKPIRSNKTTDRIIDVVKTMIEKTYTHIPILDEKGVFVGVFSESTIAKWLANSVENDGFILAEVAVGEIKQHLEQGGDKFNAYEFVPRNMNIFDVQEIFSNAINKKERLGAVFVTENGSKHESILGIITSWDLPTIKNLS